MAVAPYPHLDCGMPPSSTNVGTSEVELPVRLEADGVPALIMVAGWGHGVDGSLGTNALWETRF